MAIDVQNRGQISNPYAKENRAEYKMGKVEAFLHDKLGFRTGIDQYNEQMDNAANEWNTQNQSAAYEENYNSAENQTERLQAAGINPDLAGNIQAGQATEMTEPDSHMTSPGGMDMEAIGVGTEWAAKLTAMALDMATGSAGYFSTMTNAAIGLKKGITETDTQEAELGKTLRQMANDSYGEFEKLIPDNPIPGQAEWMGKSHGSGGKFLAKMQGLSGRNAKKFAQMYNGMIRSATARMKEAEKQGNLNVALSKPEVALPDLYREAQQNLMRHSAKVIENELWKAQKYGEILEHNTELFKGMTVAQMQDIINKAITSGNEAEKSKYEKAIAEKDKIDRELRQRQNDADWEYLKKFTESMTPYADMNPETAKKYGDVMKRLYGEEKTSIHGPWGISIQ